MFDDYEPVWALREAFLLLDLRFHSTLSLVDQLLGLKSANDFTCGLHRGEVINVFLEFGRGKINFSMTKWFRRVQKSLDVSKDESQEMVNITY